MTRWTVLMMCFLMWMPPARSEDWPQWMGQRRDGTWQEEQVMTRFPKSGLETVWQMPIGLGFAGPAVADGRVFVTDFVKGSGTLTNNASARDKVTGRERILAFDEATGRQLWVYEYPVSVQVSYASGPRTTPTVDGDRVYALGTNGHVAALQVKTGELLWSLDLPRAFQTEIPFWGFSSHLLIVDDLLITLAGGDGSTVVALDKKTGHERWRALSASEPGYCPPTLVSHAGKQQLLVWHPESINGLEPESGRVLWSIPLKANAGMSLTAPQKWGDGLFVSGIGTVPTLFKWKGTEVTPQIAWQAHDGRSLSTGNSTPVVDRGVVYGVDTRGYLIAIEMETGELLWSTLEPTTGARPAKYATAFLVKNHDHYYIFNERGDLISAKLSRDGYREIDRTHLIEPTTRTYNRNVVWVHPAFANGSVFVRNDGEIKRYSLKAKTVGGAEAAPGK
ncbi:PQQ-binding-like beta-propeller repeat protein [Sulfidibacter corallicola]|uniref:PQQ-like beta-propeller repeat protein n=1 Tax=Sulfidibacter corallicola TaxID=2818388 RepID=A0A8A4TM48_SULCO|nr:PQQ-binding-like beta-propeller repeat protein [Sulfidibacter corallicola]QTD50633.1 PQQ-like beta-propeller repeat protein [Sulfidibacter corallicola]